MKTSITLAVPCAALLAISGCAQSLAIHVVDLDHGYAPIANASIARYPSPPRRGDPWTTTAAQTQTTDADGLTTFAHDTGRFVISAPGKASASFYSTFAPQTMEIGLTATMGSAPATK